MKEWKEAIVDAIIGKSETDKIISLRDIALESGVKHINRQDSVDIMHAVQRKLTNYKPVMIQYGDRRDSSLFVTLNFVERDVEFDNADPLVGIDCAAEIRDGDSCGSEFKALADGEWFRYEGMLGWKINPFVAVFVNRQGRFIRARCYSNCLSIGTASEEFEKFSTAANVPEGWRER